jgi:hypothetical protein
MDAATVCPPPVETRPHSFRVIFIILDSPARLPNAVHETRNNAKRAMVASETSSSESFFHSLARLTFEWRQRLVDHPGEMASVEGPAKPGRLQLRVNNHDGAPGEGVG